MTWMQIFWLVLMYFLLAELIIRHIAPDRSYGRTEGWTVSMYHVAIESNYWFDVVLTVVVWICWPTVFIVLYFQWRKDRVNQVIRRLEGFE